MTYRLLKKVDDEDIPIILSVYMQPSVSRFIDIDKENYWKYVTGTDNVYFYKVFQDDVLVATIHLELVDRVLYMSIVVFPKYQKQGIATIIIKDIQTGTFKLDFTSILVSIDEKNSASIKLFEKSGFECIGKEEELLEYAYVVK